MAKTRRTKEEVKALFDKIVATMESKGVGAKEAAALHNVAGSQYYTWRKEFGTQPTVVVHKPTVLVKKKAQSGLDSKVFVIVTTASNLKQVMGNL